MPPVSGLNPRLRAFLERGLGFLCGQVNRFTGLSQLHDLLLDWRYEEICRASGNPLLSPLRSGFGQVDEDAVLARILSRLGLMSESDLPHQFVELGVGDGLENNTLTLLLHGWQGQWHGGGDPVRLCPHARLEVHRQWLTLESLREQVIPRVRCLDRLKVLSLDLDGNDWWFARELLEQGICPDVWVQVYNALLGPHALWTIPYDEAHAWELDSFYRASLRAFHELFAAHGYLLVACSASGANAFFVKACHEELFKDVPREVDQLFMPRRHWLYRDRGRVSPRMTRGVRPPLPGPL